MLLTVNRARCPFFAFFPPCLRCNVAPDVIGEGNVNGFGLEFYIETPADEVADTIHDIKKSWQFQLLYTVSQLAAGAQQHAASALVPANLTHPCRCFQHRPCLYLSNFHVPMTIGNLV